MLSISELFTTYGPLGVWVAYSVVRERWMMAKMEELSLRFDTERNNWHKERMRWVNILGRKGIVSADTVMEITEDR